MEVLKVVLKVVLILPLFKLKILVLLLKMHKFKPNFKLFKVKFKVL